MAYKHTNKSLDLLGRIMRAEAIGEGRDGMLMVGNVVNNRLIVNCHVFGDLRTLEDVIHQENAFASINSPLFTSRATTKEKELAKKSLKGYTLYPASNALWFYAPRKGEACRTTWFEQQLAGQYKGHCFYRPDGGVCEELR